MSALAWKALNIFSSETLLLLHQPHIFIYSSTIFSHFWTRWGRGAGGERALIPTRLVR